VEQAVKLVDEASRRRALTDLRSSLLVEAAAGTGKTSLMAGRVAMLLADGCEPRNVAAITFTELAASELSTRIRSYVHELLAGRIPRVFECAAPGGLSEPQKVNLQAAAQRLDELTTSTIHGFCQEVIRSYAIEAGLDPGSRVIDAPNADAMFDSAFSDWLIGRLSQATSSDDAVAVLSKDDPLHVADILKKLASLKRDHPTAKTLPAQADARPDIDFCEAVNEFARWFARTKGEKKTASIVAGLETLSQYYKDCFARPLDFRRLWALGHPPRMSAMKARGFELAPYRCKGAWQEEYGNDEGGRLNGEAESCFANAESAYRRLLGHIANRLVGPLSTALDEVLVAYSAKKRAAAVLDFDDLLLRAHDLVDRHESVRQALGRRFLHVFVDEFQDTDPVQAAFIFLLAAKERPARWQDARLRPGALFLVGDPKQAIYRFRGADIAAYKLARSAMEAQASDAVLQVTANFRSQKEILEYVNACFAPVLSGAEQPGYVALSHTIVERHHDLPCISKVAVELPPSPRAHEQRDAEADLVADICHRLIGAVEIVRSDGSRSALKPSDIALLAPTRTDLWRYERALEARGLSVASQAGKTLFLRQETQDVLTLLRVLADPLDTLAFGALMRGPLIGISDEELLDITEELQLPGSDQPHPPTFNVMTSPEEVSHPLAREVLFALQDLRRRAVSTTPMLLLAEAAERLRVRVMLASRYRNRSARALANLDALIEMARPYGVAGLRNFVRDLQYDWENRTPRSEGRTDASEDAVEIVTIHSSKGLEWPVIIPVNTATEFLPPPQFLHRQSDNTLHWVLGGVTPVDLAHARAEEEQNGARERERMWYVACTRARDILILPHLTAAPARSWSRILDLDHARLPQLNLEGLPEVAPAELPPTINAQTAESFAAEALCVQDASPGIGWKRPSDHDQDRSDIFEVAPTETEALLELAVPVSGGRLRGILLHKLIEELLTGELLEDDTAIAARAKVLSEQLVGSQGADPRPALDPEEAANTAMRTLKLPDIAPLRRRLVPELAVWSSSPDGKQLLSGRSDAVLIEDGRVTAVLDWKSDVAPSAQTRTSYLGQLSDYLASTGAERGAIVYMTFGEVVWLPAQLG
jgi:ATP-dependent exoDNAse (exonuclease V) beta subunit